jgi:hypothetical protein
MADQTEHKRHHNAARASWRTQRRSDQPKQPGDARVSRDCLSPVLRPFQTAPYFLAIAVASLPTGCAGRSKRSWYHSWQSMACRRADQSLSPDRSQAAAKGPPSPTAGCFYKLARQKLLAAPLAAASLGVGSAPALALVQDDIIKVGGNLDAGKVLRRGSQRHDAPTAPVAGLNS